MARCMSERDIQALIKKTQKQVALKPVVPTATYDKTLELRSEPADNQDELDAQFAFMKKRDH